MPYTAMGQTELANHIPEIMVRSANEGLEYLRKYLNLARTVRKDFGGDFATRGKVLNIPVRGTLTVNDKTAKNNVTVQAPQDDTVQVILNKHKEVTFLIEDVAQAVAIPGALEAYIRDAVAVLAEQVEMDLAGEYVNAGTTLDLGDFASWREAMRRARRTLVTNKIPANSPMFAQLDEYAVYYPIVYGSDAMVLAVRPLPDWGNGNGVSQMSVSDAESGLAMRSTIGYDKNGLGLQVTLDMLYGVKTIRPELLVAISHEPSVNN